MSYESPTLVDKLKSAFSRLKVKRKSKTSSFKTPQDLLGERYGQTVPNPNTEPATINKVPSATANFADAPKTQREISQASVPRSIPRFQDLDHSGDVSPTDQPIFREGRPHSDAVSALEQEEISERLRKTGSVQSVQEALAKDERPISAIAPVDSVHQKTSPLIVIDSPKDTIRAEDELPPSPPAEVYKDVQPLPPAKDGERGEPVDHTEPKHIQEPELLHEESKPELETASSPVQKEEEREEVKVVESHLEAQVPNVIAAPIVEQGTSFEEVEKVEQAEHIKPPVITEPESQLEEEESLLRDASVRAQPEEESLPREASARAQSETSMRPPIALDIPHTAGERHPITLEDAPRSGIEPSSASDAPIKPVIAPLSMTIDPEDRIDPTTAPEVVNDFGDEKMPVIDEPVVSSPIAVKFSATSGPLEDFPAGGEYYN